ncbi:MAG: DUF4286 family protein [Flavobacteriales bacterium]|nr:DUF4286 family protein [Flavobacteriales bacterium]
MKHRVLYNVTVSIDRDVEKEWLEWMKKVHIPDVMRTGYFIENKICRIHAHEEGGVSYAIQYMCLNMSDLEEYQREHAPRLQEEHTRRYGGKFAAFRTILEIVHEHKPAITDVHPN